MSLLAERPHNFCKFYLILFLDNFDSHRKKLSLILFLTNMVSLGPKKVGADQVLAPEFLVSFTVSSFSTADILFNIVSSVILMGTKMC